MTISNIKKRLDAIEKVKTSEDSPRIYINSGELSQEILRDTRYLVYIPESHR